MSDEPIDFIGSIAPTNSGLTIHGIDGYRMLVDIPNDELAAIMRLALVRGKALRFRVTEEDAEPPRKRKAKQKEPEWGDDESGDDTG